VSRVGGFADAVAVRRGKVIDLGMGEHSVRGVDVGITAVILNN